MPTFGIYNSMRYLCVHVSTGDLRSPLMCPTGTTVARLQRGVGFSTTSTDVGTTTFRTDIRSAIKAASSGNVHGVAEGALCEETQVVPTLP